MVVTMENILLFITCLFGIFKASSGSIMTIPSIVGMKGSKVTLECRYDSSQRWYLMQWKRQYQNKDITITTLPNLGKSSTPTPIWEEDIEPNLRTRARTSVYIDIDTVDFKLSIHDFSCNDTGKYTCEVTGPSVVRNSTNLTITAKPESPSIIDDEIILEENDTYTLECTADAGIPEADLRWYYKVPRSTDFSRIDIEPKQEIVKVDDCSQRATQRIDVMVNKETDGIVYRCKVESDLLNEEENTSFYDDVILKLPKKVVPQPEYRTPTQKPLGSNSSGYIDGYVTVLLTTLVMVIRCSL